ncbi:MAG: AMP-binding protein, partial [Caulobacterales bacterium]|nr:AMP-binding protein [Caulobacterales bacterium]
VNELGCTSWFSVPSLLVYLLTLKALGKNDFSSIRRIIFGGEGFPKGKLKELHDLFGGTAELINVYGPTECTCICSSYLITQADVDDQSQLAPLGHMAPNFSYHIDPIDPAKPDFGELLLGGPNVGLGYFNDEERTRQAFVQDPTEPRARHIMYRTGDLVELADDGYVHFRGRADNQIKHMGYRIELEEIEAAFNRLESVDEAAVIYRKTGEAGGAIIAFVGCREEADGRALIEEVRASLPPYMVPKQVRVMAALPKNANGKIDRAHLKGMQ